MATGGSPSPQPGQQVTSPSDCPQCGSLCLGPVALNCGHVLCRKCLHDMLEERDQHLSCQQCGHQLNLPRRVTVSQLVQQLGTNPVVENLVQQELKNITDVSCLICPNVLAEKVCLDCQEYYCDICSINHCKSRVAKDHVLYRVSQAVQNTSSGAPATSTPRPRSSSITSIASSIRNPALSQSQDTSRDGSEWNDWTRNQMTQLQKASADKLETRTILQDIESFAHELSIRVHTDEQEIDAYQNHLPRLGVTQRKDQGTYVLQSRDSDVPMTVKMESLEKCLRHVMHGRHCLDQDVLRMVRTQLDQMLHPADGQDETFSTPTGSPTSSFIRTFTSGQLPVATPSPNLLPTSGQLSAANPSPTHLPTPGQLSAATPSLTPLPTSGQLSAVIPSPTHTFTPAIADVMAATPRRLFSARPAEKGDREKPWISAIVCLPDDRIVMTDYNNKKVKVMGETPPHTVSDSVDCKEIPHRLALLSDGLVAVTTCTKLIYLISVTKKLTVTSQIKTVRLYYDIAGLIDGHLLVSCKEGSTGPAALYVLTRRGDVVRTVTDSTRLPGLQSPWSILLDVDNHVLVADRDKDLVHRIEVSSGHVTHTYAHADIRYPEQVCADMAGNVYVACYDDSVGDGWVLVRNKGGQWRRLVTSDLSDPGYVWPWGLCLTKTGCLVVLWGKKFDSVVVCYDLV